MKSKRKVKNRNSNFNFYLLSTPWTYECHDHKCKRVELTNGQIPASLSTCRIFCGVDPGTLWPRINGKISLKEPMIRFDQNAIQFSFHNRAKPDDRFWHINKQRFREQISKKLPPLLNLTYDGNRLMIIIDVNETSKLGLSTNEHYQIHGHKEQNAMIVVNITAETIFGARHALETISQLIVFDNIRRELQIVGDFNIDDRPAFPHRGFLLDTIRNYFTIDSIKRTIGNRHLSSWIYVKMYCI